MEPETRLAGNDHLTGPFMKAVVDPPDIAEVEVPVTEGRFADEVASMPAVSQRT